MSVLKIKKDNEWITVNSPLSEELPLSIANGGTGNTIGRAVSAEAASTLSETLEIAKGGTGATTVNGIYSNLQLPRVSNPNLLDNWCFLPGCIVNQRGASSYAKPDADNNSSKFGYDRWHLRNVTATAQTNGLELRKNGGTPYLLQTVENANALKGKTVTASFLLDGITGTSTDFFAAVSNGPFSIAVGTEFGNSTSCQNGMISVTCSIPADVTINYFNVLMRIRDGNDTTACTLVAAKLELGTQQTLAHKDASGNWVLNEVPNYAEQLARCMRYYQAGACTFVASNANNLYGAVTQLSPSMRAAPEIILSGITNISGTAKSATIASVTTPTMLPTIQSSGTTDSMLFGSFTASADF